MAALSLLVFELRGRRCALPISAAREVFAVGAVTPVPTAPPVVRGLVPLRGQVLPLCDLGVFLAQGSDAPARTGDTAVLLEWLDDDGGKDDEGERPPLRAALVVDRVLSLETVDDESARPVPGAPDFAALAVGGAAGPTLLFDPGAALARIKAAVAASARTT